MKISIIKYIVFISLLAGSLRAQNENPNLLRVHQYRESGPFAIQLLWLDNDSSQGFWERQIWLKAALVCGPINQPAEQFANYSHDHHIDWETGTGAGFHHLSITFAKAHASRAFTMMAELIHHTDYDTDVLEKWRKKELYDYNYYKNDPDSLIKWLASGRLAYYKTLADMDFSAEPGNVIAALGKPHAVSTVGPIKGWIVGNTLDALVETDLTIPLKKRAVVNASSSLPWNSLHHYSAFAIGHQNPLWAAYHFQGLKQQVKAVSASEFTYGNASAWLSFKRDHSTNLDSVEIAFDAFWRDKILTEYLLWLEYNKNEALANGLVLLNRWPADMVETFKNAQELPGGMQVSVFKLN